MKRRADERGGENMSQHWRNYEAILEKKSSSVRMVSEQLLEAILGVNKEVYRIETERKGDMSTLKIVLNENREKKNCLGRGGMKNVRVEECIEI